MIDWKSISSKEMFTEEEGELVRIVCEGKKVLEIGAFQGRSTCCIADVAELIHTVDLFNNDFSGERQFGPPDCINPFLEHTKDRKNIQYTIGNSVEVVPKLEDNFFDVVFIDGLHQEYAVRADILNSHSKLKEDGIYIIHDYSDDPTKWGDVKRVTDELFSMPEKPIRLGLLIILERRWLKT